MPIGDARQIDQHDPDEHVTRLNRFLDDICAHTNALGELALALLNAEDLRGALALERALFVVGQCRAALDVNVRASSDVSDGSTAV
jgi:hypothetical protein